MVRSYEFIEDTCFWFILGRLIVFRDRFLTTSVPMEQAIAGMAWHLIFIYCKKVERAANCIAKIAVSVAQR
jgi:hypothetical protein